MKFDTLLKKLRARISKDFYEKKFILLVKVTDLSIGVKHLKGYKAA